MRRRALLWIIPAALLGAGLVAAAGGLIFIYSGRYDIAASRPHLAIVEWMLTTFSREAVQYHARNIEAPPLDDPDLVRRGLVLYREYCVVCHGAPGVPRGRPGIGLNPDPPPLVAAAREWTPAEIYWITANGLKMAGMPAFELGEDAVDLWAITAFVRRMSGLSPAEYARMVLAVEGRLDAAEIPWVVPSLPPARTPAIGDPERGAALIDAYGCGSCHVIPGVRVANGLAGPPLDGWAERHYIAGRLVNTPENLVAFLVSPPEIEPRTAMPDLGVTPEEARHMAAYLYTLR